MPNEPKPARQKRAPTPDRRNDQGDHEGSAHGLDAFDKMNPQKQGLGDKKTGQPSKSSGGKR